jgi:Ca2+-binding RTX toxin-like protein
MANTLTITADHDYSNDPLDDVSDFVFNTSGFTVAAFAASQFDDDHISQSVHITGDSHQSFITVNLTAPGMFLINNWTFTDFESGDAIFINGSTGADTITGNDFQGAVFAGGGGADTLIGGSQVDTFEYFGPTDIEPGETINGGGLPDIIQVQSNGSTYDFSGASFLEVERLVMNIGGPGGTATVILSGGQIGPTAIAEVQSGPALTSTLIVVGSSVDLSAVTFINWTNNVDTLRINGTAGADNLIGSGQNDLIQGFSGGDALNGGDGNDTFLLAGAQGVGDTFLGGIGTDTLKVTGAGPATLTGFNALGSAIEQFQGNNHGVFGTAAANLFNFASLTSKSALPFVDGGAGNDTLTGSNFADNFHGGSGRDTLKGGAGRDTLLGGLNHDTLTGGTERDIFDFNSLAESKVGAGNRDTITDFKHGTNVTGDDIDLRTIDAKTGVGGNQAFHFIGTQHFHDVKGELRIVKVGANVVVGGDVNGDGKADFQILVQHHTSLSAGDFLL